MRGEHGRREDDVLAQVETVGDVLEIGADLGFARIALGPLPFAIKLRVEAVAIDLGFGIGAGSRVAVPVPSSPDAIGLLDDAAVEPKLVLQLMLHERPAKPAPKTMASSFCGSFLMGSIVLTDVLLLRIAIGGPREAF
jgi:hypothetical protein